MGTRGRRGRKGDPEPWRRRRYDPQTSAGIKRQGRAEFDQSFTALQDMVRAACAQYEDWDGRVVAGISATLEFAAESPEMAHALIVQGRREKTADGDRERTVLNHFADLLASTTPQTDSLPYATHKGAIEAIAAIVRGHLQAGTERDLMFRGPDLVYLTLMPHLGVERARSWADRFGVS